MKKSNRRSGVEYQRWCKNWIERSCPMSVVHNQPMNHFRLRSGVWASRSNDIFGCIDLIVIEPNAKPTFIQCTKHTNIAERLNQFKEIPWPLWHVRVELWQKKADGSTVIMELRQVNGEFALYKKARIVRGKIEILGLGDDSSKDGAANPGA